MNQIYKILRDSIHPVIFSWMIKESLTHKEISSFISRSGISYPGARPSSIPPDQLSIDLAEEGYGEPEIGRSVLKLILERGKEYIETVCRLSKKRIREMVKDPFILNELAGENRLGLFILGLLTHPQGPMIKEIGEIERMGRQLSIAFASGLKETEKMREEMEDRLDELLAKQEGLEEEIRDLKKAEKKQRMRTVELQTELETLRKRYNEVNKRKESLEDEVRVLRRENHKLKERIDSLLEAVKEKEDLEKRIELLQAERERLLCEINILREERLPRTGIFVDVQNLYYAAKEAYNGMVDYGLLLSKFKENRKVIRALAYVVQSKEIDKLNFITTLESIGYEVKTRPLKVRIDGTAKGDWDIGLAIDALSMKDKIDTIVLISGDGDFVDLVKAFKSYGVKVEVASFPHSTAQELRSCANVYHSLNEEILLGRRL